jgi:hypothetical protein
VSEPCPYREQYDALDRLAREASRPAFDDQAKRACAHDQGELLAVLRCVTYQRVKLDALAVETVRLLREGDQNNGRRSWSDIGWALGMTKQSAAERFGTKRVATPEPGDPLF